MLHVVRPTNQNPLVDWWEKHVLIMGDPISHDLAGSEAKAIYEILPSFSFQLTINMYE